jgi:hypothetical protein
MWRCGKFSSWLTNETRPTPKRTAFFRFFHILGKVVGILFLLLLCFFVGWRTLLYHEINKRFAQLRASGLPASGAELNEWLRPVPDAENGVLAMTHAFALIRNFPDARSKEVDKLTIFPRTNKWSPVTRKLVEEYVQTNGAALAKAHEALLFPRFRYRIDFSNWPDTDLSPHLEQLKKMARISALQSELEAEEDRPDEFPEHAEFQLKIAATLDGEPTVISHLVRNSIVRVAVSTTERTLNLSSPNDTVCQKLQTEFIQAGKTHSLPLALIGERAMMIPAFRLSYTEIPSLNQNNKQETRMRFSGKPQLFSWLSGIFERDLNFFLEVMEKSIALAAVPPPNSLALTNYLASADRIATGRFYIFSSMFLPSLSRTTVSEASSQARIELAITALAVERFRHAQRRLPADLKELTPQFLEAIPTDPFDGAALRYRRLARGYVIYSIGEDGHDDGGREAPERKNITDKSTCDITFTVER